MDLSDGDSALFWLGAADDALGSGYLSLHVRPGEGEWTSLTIIWDIKWDASGVPSVPLDFHPGLGTLSMYH